MKAAIISLGSKSSIMLVEAMKKYFDSVDMLDLRNLQVNMQKTPQILIDDSPIGSYDCVYIKGSYRYEPLLMSLTTLLDGKAYLPLKPNTFSLAHDKIYTQIELLKYKIPMPATYLGSNTQSVKKILKKINFPIVLKFPRGTQGKGVLFADTYSSASSILDALDTLKQPVLVQEYIETNGADIRLFVVGEKVVAAMRRIAVRGEDRANIHAGGTGEAYSPDDKMRQIAVESARAIGAEICGVDVLETARGPLVIELNSSPGLQGITKATGVDVADKIAHYLSEQTKQRLGLKKIAETKEALDVMEKVPTQIKDVITKLDFRGNRILLPELVTKIAKFDEKQDIVMNVEKNNITLKKLS